MQLAKKLQKIVVQNIKIIIGIFIIIILSLIIFYVDIFDLDLFNKKCQYITRNKMWRYLYFIIFHITIF